MEDLIPRKSLGPSNSRADLENYVVGPAPGGLVLKGQGGLIWSEAFGRVNYLAAIGSIRVRNNTQAEVSNRPVDFIAMREGDNVVLWSAPDREVRVETRLDEAGQLSLRYLPKGAFGRGLPLELWEDPKLETGSADRQEWLKAWHSEREWFQAVHATRYSNGIIDVVEALVPGPSKTTTELDEYKDRKRGLRQVDMIVFARQSLEFQCAGLQSRRESRGILPAFHACRDVVCRGRRDGCTEGSARGEAIRQLEPGPDFVYLAGEARG